MNQAGATSSMPLQCKSSGGRSRRPIGWRHRVKLVVFTLLPAILLTAAAEFALRLYELDQPQLGAPMLLCESAGLHQADYDLFWSLRPNLRVPFQGAFIVTNSLGLRCPEIHMKRDREFRILSLGESTTFGAGVANYETYSAALQQNLNEADVTRYYRVINAGVSAYSSFQSLKYLESRGFALQPDLVLFYHEYNDSLATLARDGGPKDEAALASTDPELYRSRKNRLHRQMLSISAIYRFITYLSARWQIERASASAHPVENRAGSRVATDLPVRVRPQERREILQELASVCRRHAVELVVIHPAYRDSVRHECELTEACEKQGTRVFEAFDCLHPEGLEAGALFLDGVHPNPHGHELLANGLLQFLTTQGLVNGAHD